MRSRLVRHTLCVMQVSSSGYSTRVERLKRLVSDGPVQAWAGYGAPDIAAPNGSTYQQLDGKEEKTTFYVHVGGAWMGMV